MKRLLLHRGYYTYHLANFFLSSGEKEEGNNEWMWGGWSAGGRGERKPWREGRTMDMCGDAGRMGSRETKGEGKRKDEILNNYTCEKLMM